MRRMLYMESRTPGALMVNGQFCGPLEPQEGQAFPAGDNEEIYIQLFPFSRAALPLSVAMRLRGGEIVRLEPQEAAYALLWPDGVIQLELTAQPADAPQPESGAEPESSAALLRYLTAKIAGDPHADTLLMSPQTGADVTGYDAVVPLRFPPQHVSARFDERAGLVTRLAPNVARVDAALARTVPAGQGRRMIERIEIVESR